MKIFGMIILITMVAVLAVLIVPLIPLVGLNYLGYNIAYTFDSWLGAFFILFGVLLVGLSGYVQTRKLGKINDN
jgi:uncharacterized membrane protein